MNRALEPRIARAKRAQVDPIRAHGTKKVPTTSGWPGRSRVTKE